MPNKNTAMNFATINTKLIKFNKSSANICEKQ